MRPPVRRLLAGALATLLALGSAPALADFQSAVTVRLIAPGGIQGDPTPISVSQIVNTANLLTGVQAGDGGDIGSGWMLDGEEIRFVGNSIRVRSFAGFDDASGIFTDYLGDGVNPARYEFDGLSIAGQTIVGFTVSAFDGYADSGFSGLASPSAASLVQLIDADTLSLDLSSILFVDRGNGTGSAFADFRCPSPSRRAAGPSATASCSPSTRTPPSSRCSARPMAATTRPPSRCPTCASAW